MERDLGIVSPIRLPITVDRFRNSSLLMECSLPCPGGKQSISQQNFTRPVNQIWKSSPHRGSMRAATQIYFSRSVASHAPEPPPLLLSAFIFVINQILSQGRIYRREGGGTCSFKAHVCAPCKLVAIARDSCYRTR